MCDLPEHIVRRPGYGARWVYDLGGKIMLVDPGIHLTLTSDFNHRLTFSMNPDSYCLVKITTSAS